LDNFDEHSKVRIASIWSLTTAAPSDSVFRALCTNLLTYLLTTDGRPEDDPNTECLSPPINSSKDAPGW